METTKQVWWIPLGVLLLAATAWHAVSAQEDYTHTPQLRRLAQTSSEPVRAWALDLDPATSGEDQTEQGNNRARFHTLPPAADAKKEPAQGDRDGDAGDQKEEVDEGNDLQATFDKLSKDFAKHAEESEEEFESLEEKIDDGLEELGDELGGLTGDKTFLHSGGKATMKLTGRIHMDYWSFPETDAAIDELEGGPDGPQARLGFRRMRFGVAGDLPSNMLYKIEMEFAGGNASEFRDVYFGWKELPCFRTVLIGNQKRPYGLDHLNSSRYNIFLERPYIIESFNQDARRFGICSYGFSENERWNWRSGVFNQRLIQADGNYTNDNLQLETASRLATTFWYDEVSGGRGYGHLGVSHAYASPDGSVDGDNGGTGPDQNETRFRSRPEARSATRWIDTGRIAGADSYHLLGLENVWNFGPLQFVGEYQNIWLKRDPGAGADLFLWGGYMQASYFLTGEHMPWDRESGTLDRIKPFEDFFLVNRCRGGIGKGLGAWQVAARYSYADFNDANIAGGIGESFTLGLNWYWTSTARLQFNWLHGSITNNAVTRGVPLSGRYDILGTRIMVDF